MKKIIIFNWKMYPSSLKEAKELFNSILKQIKNLEIVVAAPFIYLSEFVGLINKTKIKLGAQDVFYKDEGAYTGEISPTMLKNLGVEYIIIGHSERRKYLDETDEMINKKVSAALKTGLKVVLCVGEPSRATSGKRQETNRAKNYVKRQLEKDLKGVKNMSYVSGPLSLIIVYEPVWAISTSGTGKICQPKDALKMIKFIKKFLSVKCQVSSVKVLYGGSVDSKNIKNFVKYSEIDGALVGGASLKIKEVKKIIKIIK